MEDHQIIELFFNRNEQAIDETAEKYGSYCYTIAFQILHDADDAQESVNDTYLSAWNTIPPQRPSILSAFLGKITRSIAISKWRKKTAVKRGGGQITSSLEELSECIPDYHTPECQVESEQLQGIINVFLHNLPKKERSVFICRYWYMDTISSIAKQFGFSENKVRLMLMRTRKKLKEKLYEEGLL